MKKDILYREPIDADKIGAIVISVAFLAFSYWMQDLVLLVSTQILMIGIIIFVIHQAKIKTKEISQWIQPYIYSIPPVEIPIIVRWNLFSMSPLFNRYKIEIEKRNRLESKLKASKKEIKNISDTINNLNNKISKCKAENPEESLSLASKTEINILSEKISNQNKQKNKIIAECSKLEISIEDNGHTLNKLKEDARVIIIKSKKRYNEKYEKEVKSEEEKRKRREERKEKEKNDIKELVREIEELINYKKMNTTDDAKIEELALMESQLKKIFESFELDRLPYVDAKNEIESLKNDIDKIITK